MRAGRENQRCKALADADLMVELSGGSRSALGELYDRYGERAYRVAASICRDQADAQDVVVAAFRQVWQHRATYQPPAGTIAAWLLISVRAMAIDVTRRTVGSTDDGPHPGPAPEAARNRGSTTDAERLHDLLAQLPEAEREVITLAVYGQLSHTDIAAQLGLGADTVKGRMRLGMHQLTSQLQAMTV